MTIATAMGITMDVAIAMGITVVLVPFLEALSGTPINCSVWIATLLACTATPGDVIATTASASADVLWALQFMWCDLRSSWRYSS
ncbi:hypothetical protein CLOM_g16895 [Closterium sp. NIES-68]|nr:hypothetical protein CLOM_g16895 [Closterium sp. NIES-68]